MIVNIAKQLFNYNSEFTDPE